MIFYTMQDISCIEGNTAGKFGRSLRKTSEGTSKSSLEESGKTRYTIVMQPDNV